MKDFRKRQFTTRYTNATQADIEKLRATRLSKAKNYSERKFYSSNEFDKQVRRNIRSNRVKKNIKALESITSRIGNTQDQRKAFQSFFGERTKYTKSGKRTINSFSSLQTTKKLQKITKQLQAGTFNLNRRIANTPEFKKVRKYLPAHPSRNEIAQALINKPFYYENRAEIKSFNAHTQKHGYKSASKTKNGKALRETYKESLNEEDESLFASMLKYE